MQFSLFDKRPLFDKVTLERRRSEWRTAAIEGLSVASRALEAFVREVRVKRRGTSKETALEQAFNAAFFVELLGYTLYPGAEGAWTAWPKPPSAATRLVGEPDVILGSVTPDGFDINAVVELKKPDASLDAPQASYGNRTPVEQAFGYARKLTNCRWVIVSNMRLVRLYSIETPDAYHEIDLWSDGVDGLAPATEAYQLLSYANLVEHGFDSGTARLLATAQTEQASFRDGFYTLYSQIRADLLDALEAWSDGSHSREELVSGVQRLLDRLLFIYFCEDHPDRLLRNDLVKGVVTRAVQQPGSSETKAFDALKQLFRDLDVGAQTEFWQVPRYNGEELFKPHGLVDMAELPDSLHAKRFVWMSPTNVKSKRTVEGVYGLHIFDFWRELDRDLLGNLFERSLGDLTALSHGGRPDARAAFGVFYTAGRLAHFAAQSAVHAMLDADVELTALLSSIGTLKDSQQLEVVGKIVDRLKGYRVADLACGSGVFLTAALEALLTPYRKALEALRVGAMETDLILSHRQAEVLKEAIYGEDLLPQAVELAKLALWLTAARRNEPSADLSNNFVAGDTLQSENLGALLDSAGRSFDLIVGNPPWGAEIDRTRAAELAADAGLPVRDGLDSWEVFLCVVISALKDGGRFALVLPDTIFSANKQETRAWLLRMAKLEKFYSLGPEWFTSSVRMGTVFVQGVKTSEVTGPVRTLLLAGSERQEAQQGRRPLEQSRADRFQPYASGEDVRSPTKPNPSPCVYRGPRSDRSDGGTLTPLKRTDVPCSRGRNERGGTALALCGLQPLHGTRREGERRRI